jgi:hypothetical protein
LGFALRSFLLPNGFRPHYRPNRPAYRFAHRCSRRRSDEPAQQAAVPGLSPVRESLASDPGLANRPLVAPLSFALLGSSQRPSSDFRPTSSHALCMSANYSPNTPTPQSLDRPSLRPIPIPRRNATSDRPTLLGSLHRHAPGIQTRDRPGYVFTSRCAVRYRRPTNDLRTIRRLT